MSVINILLIKSSSNFWKLNQANYPEITFNVRVRYLDFISSFIFASMLRENYV